MVYCAAFNCRNIAKAGSGISFHKFPLRGPVLLSKWLAALKRDKFFPSRHSKICSVHFSENDFWISSGLKLLKHDAIPSKFDFPAHLQKIEKAPRRLLKRNRDAASEVIEWKNKRDYQHASSSVTANISTGESDVENSAQDPSTNLLEWNISNFENNRRFENTDEFPMDELYSPLFLTSQVFSEYCENVLVYIAGFFVRRISRIINCHTCEKSLYGDQSLDHISFLLRKQNGGLVIPSKQVVKIIHMCEHAVRQLLNATGGMPPKGPINIIIKKSVLEELNMAATFPELSEHCMDNEFPENHILRIVSMVIDTYVKVRCHHTAKTYNLDLHKNIVRQHLSKSILFLNQ